MPGKKEEKKDEKSKENESKEKKEPEKPKLSPAQQLEKDMNDSVADLARSVQTRDRRLQARAIGRMTSFRKRLTLSFFREFCAKYYPDAGSYLENLMDDEPEEKVEATAEGDEAKAEEAKEAKIEYTDEAKELQASAPELAEVKLFVQLLVAMYIGSKGLLEETVRCVTECVELLHSNNRRTSDIISAKVYQLYSLSYERVGRLTEIRSQMLAFHRSACLSHNEPAQATLAVCILRNYLNCNLVNQADNFRNQIRFPENCSNNQHARYLFYIGRIESVRLAYSKAFNALSQAIRKSPVRKETIGFRQAANKLLIIVQLLMGEIPERSLFLHPDLRTALKPYFHLTRAVRVGDLRAFSEVMTPTNKQHFIKDNTYSLIVRLRHNVIKTGLRKINVSYSKISMADISHKLKLESEEDAEYIVAKAIHDGVVDAVLDRKEHVMVSKPFVDVYATQEPSVEFHKRIEFCLNTHNEAVKAMSYPPNAHKTQAELDAEEAERNKDKPTEHVVMDPDEMDE